MSWCSDDPEDEVICLFAGLLPNPDVTLSLICCVHHRFDDEVKDDTHVAFIPEMMEFPRATWIETFLEG